MNWKVRIKNKAFWLSIIPAILLMVEAIAAVFGYTLDFGDRSNKLVTVVNTVFAVLVIIGVAVDPTIAGFGDSDRVMTYTEPYQDE